MLRFATEADLLLFRLRYLTWNVSSIQGAGAEFFTWTQGMAALDETNDAIRKRIVDLDYDEAAQVAAMHRRKAATLLALPDQIGEVMQENPHWA